jgi:hypothetical protein
LVMALLNDEKTPSSKYQLPIQPKLSEILKLILQ